MHRLLPAIILLSGCSWLPERLVEVRVPVMGACELPGRLREPVPENERPRFDVMICDNETRWALKPGHEIKYINLLKRDKAWREAADDMTAPLGFVEEPEPLPDPPWYWPF